MESKWWRFRSHNVASSITSRACQTRGVIDGEPLRGLQTVRPIRLSRDPIGGLKHLTTPWLLRTRTTSTQTGELAELCRSVPCSVLG